MRLIYTALLYVIQPLVWLKLWLRGRKAPAYRQRIKERYGFSDQSWQPNGIWLHSVSVGETLAAVPLIRVLQQKYPRLPITVTTMTPTGSEQVKKQLGDSVQHAYLPYDLPDAMSRLIHKVQPQVVVIMETELWPNFLYQLEKRQIPVILANGRLSERSAKGYQKVRSLMTPMLQSLSHLIAQYQEDADRYLSLGAPKDRTTVCGNIKFDISVSSEMQSKVETLKTQYNLWDRPVWIAASTHEGEEEILLAAHQQVLRHVPNTLLILVPRHPERFNAVAQQIESANLIYQRRTQAETLNDATQVLLGDTMGELMMLMGLGQAAFIGGSLIERGGHNPLEPAAYALPILMGKHTFNFAAVCDKLTQAAGLITISNAKEIAHHLAQWQSDPQEAQRIGQNALHVLQRNQGALEKQLNIIESFLKTQDRRPNE